MNKLKTLLEVKGFGDVHQKAVAEVGVPDPENAEEIIKENEEDEASKRDNRVASS